MRGIFRWAADAGHVKIDPTVGVKNPARPKGGGFPVWTEDDVARYEARWRVGTKQRVWLDVLAYTGLRRGDAVQLGRQHVRDGVATMRTEKTGVTVTIPILPALAATLAAGPCGELAFICGDGGRPLTKESFGNLFRDACRLAGVTRVRTASARSARPGRPITAQRSPSWKRSLAGREAVWPRSTRAPPIGRAWPRARCHKLERTASEHSIPSPDIR